MSSTRRSSVLTIAAVATLAAVVGYAVYFDHKRRNDVEFRKKLRKQQKKVHRSVSKEKLGSLTPEDLREAIRTIKAESIPKNPVEMEQYFTETVARGEQLSVQGEKEHLAAAMCFFRALRVYPNQMELLLIYQRVVPEPILKIVQEMWAYEMMDHTEEYYDYFPPTEMNVKVKTVPVDPEDEKLRKRVLVASKDFEAGEVIYKEEPIVAALIPQLESRKLHCSHCLRRLEDQPLEIPEDPLKAAYCSEACRSEAASAHYDLLFGTIRVPSLPNEGRPDLSVQEQAERVEAQQKLVSLYTKGSVSPLLVARFLGKQVREEFEKLALNDPESKRKARRPEDVDKRDYTLFDHIDRLRYMEVFAEEEEFKTIFQLLKTGMPGLENVISDEKYEALKGKMAYNAIGIYHDDSADYKISTDVRERSRISVLNLPTGYGLYHVSSYLSHSCAPNVYPLFKDGTSTLHLIAKTSIKAGDEITMAYVNVSHKEGEDARATRLRRRQELAVGWGMVCKCPECRADAPAKPANEQTTSNERNDGSAST